MLLKILLMIIMGILLLSTMQYLTTSSVSGHKMKLEKVNEIEEVIEDYKLTEMEKKIFKATLDNFTVRQIAEKENLAQQTIKNYRGGIFSKLKVKNSEELREKFQNYK